MASVYLSFLIDKFTVAFQKLSLPSLGVANLSQEIEAGHVTRCVQDYRHH